MVLLKFHLHVRENSAAFWWIDSPQVPNLYASGETIVNARQSAMARLDDAGIDVEDMHYEIVDA